MKTKRFNVLVVDDSQSVRKFVRDELEQLQIDVIEASDGLDAIEQITTDRPDLIITDIEMPRKNGIELCRHLHSHIETQDIPIIIISALETDRDIEKGFDAGASAYIPKSEIQSTLTETVERVLSQISVEEKRNILVVDDSQAILNMLRDSLEKNNFHVTTACDGYEALEILNSLTTKTSIILSDISMPNMDGFQLCAKVRRNPEWNKIPFVAMSTHRDKESIQRILYYGATTFIMKPFNMEQLIVLINKLLSDVFLAMFHDKERLKREQQLLISAITSLITALEARDAYTKGHSENVSSMVEEIAKMASLPPDKLEKVVTGARLHDIGKIGIRDDILFNDDDFTPEELLKIKEHPVIGAKIIQPIKSLSEAVDIVKYHHERWDGSGYPDGLKGEEIPFWARVVSVVDTFDALTSDRPYQKSRSSDKAIEIIKKLEGIQLCPKSVELFMQWAKERDLVTNQ